MTKTLQYKNTPIGPIPTDWEVRILKEIANIKGRIGYRGYTVNDIVDKDSGAVTISPSNFSNGSLDIKDSTYISWNKYYESPEIMVRNNDILLVKTGSTYGKSCLVSNLTKSATINPQIVIIKEVNQDIKYLSYIVSDKIFQNQISKIVVGGAIPTLSQEAILKFSIPLPPLPEQQKIAEVLSTWDKAIQDTNTIIKKLETRNKALAFSLLTGKKRVNGFEDKWNNYKLDHFLEEYSSKPNGEIDLPVFTSSKNGLMNQFDYYSGGRISSRENVDYNIIPDGYITYRSRSDDGLFTFNKNTTGYDGLISGYYPVFKIVNGNDDFFLFYLNFFKNKLTKYSTGTSQLVLSFKALKSATFHLPSLEEQNEIAEILNTANQEVKQYQQKLETLKLQKKGLMQQLLTGKVRTV